MTKTTTPTTTPASAGTIALVPVRHLRESPFNPRKHYGPAALQELAASITSQGMLQPIVARDLPAGQQDIWVRHEIVFGHRRFRAAQLAGLDTVPVVLRPFTDEQAALAQVAENLQRQDVTALEEADSFQRLHATHGMTADAIADGVNKSRSYVYGRLKLAKLAPEVRTAMLDDGLPADIAIELARLTEPALQVRALKDVKGWAYGETWPSVRTAQQRVRGMFDNDVDAADFDPADAGLLPHAGACGACPKRAGNDPDLQGVVAAGVCTDRECWAGKLRAHNKVEILALAGMGHPVIQGAEADRMMPSRRGTPAGYNSAEAGEWVAGKFMSFEDMAAKLAGLGEAAPKATVLALDGGADLRQFFTDAQAADMAQRLHAAADAAGADTPSKAARAAHGGGRDDEFKHADWSPAERAVVGDHWVRVKEAVLRNLMGRPRTADDLRAILIREYDQADDFGPITETLGLDVEMKAAEAAWDADDTKPEPFSYRAWWESKLDTLGPDQLAVMLLGAALWDLLGYGGWSTTRATAARKVALAERYGVDVVAAAQPEQMDGAGVAGGRSAPAGAQIDAFSLAGAA
jgi:ParB/RepB/Spo0J family partition protein